MNRSHCLPYALYYHIIVLSYHQTLVKNKCVQSLLLPFMRQILIIINQKSALYFHIISYILMSNSVAYELVPLLLSSTVIKKPHYLLIYVIITALYHRISAIHQLFYYALTCIYLPLSLLLVTNKLSL